MSTGSLKRIAISGAGGRIGSALCRGLRDLPAQVEGFSVRPDGVKSLFPTSSLVDPGVIRGMDTLIHAGWSMLPVVAEEHPANVWRDDLPLLVGILEAIRSLPEGERPLFVFLSSASVYGESKEGCSEAGTPPEPSGWYAFGKLVAEKMIQEFARRYGLKCLILRLSNVYGFQNTTSLQGVIPRLLQGALKAEDVEIWGDGETAKDYLHIDDVVAAISKIVEVRSPGVFNVSYGQSSTLAELISQVEAIVGKPLPRRYRPGFPWDVSQPLISNRLFAETFSWHPRITIREGILRSEADLTESLSPKISL